MAGPFEPRQVTHITKPWGYELIFGKTERYVGKILHVNEGESLSLQYHVVKEETLYLIAGRVRLRLSDASDDRTVIMEVGDCYHIPPGLVHQIEALEAADIVEVSTPELDDVVRLEDRYGRVAD
ncbi:MAG: cupin domain-containing protein [Acidobacteriota bacterium]